MTPKPTDITSRLVRMERKKRNEMAIEGIKLAATLAACWLAATIVTLWIWRGVQ